MNGIRDSDFSQVLRVDQMINTLNTLSLMSYLLNLHNCCNMSLKDNVFHLNPIYIIGLGERFNMRKKLAHKVFKIKVVFDIVYLQK